MRTKRNPVRLMLCATALLVACSFGGRANAQSNPAQAEFEGKFTLPYEVQWGNGVLSAGDHVIAFNHGQISNLLEIRDAKTLQIVAYEPTSIRQDVKGQSALLISVRGNQRVIRSLTVTELGETFVYPEAHKRLRTTEEARHTQTVPLFVAKK